MIALAADLRGKDWHRRVPPLRMDFRSGGILIGSQRPDAPWQWASSPSRTRSTFSVRGGSLARRLMFTQRPQATMDWRREPVGTCSDATPPRGPTEFGRDKIRELTAVCEAQGVRLPGRRYRHKAITERRHSAINSTRSSKAISCVSKCFRFPRRISPEESAPHRGCVLRCTEVVDIRRGIVAALGWVCWCLDLVRVMYRFTLHVFATVTSVVATSLGVVACQAVERIAPFSRMCLELSDRLLVNRFESFRAPAAPEDVYD